MDDALDAARAELVELGVDTGIAAEAPPDSFARLAAEQSLWGGPPTLTAADVAARADLDEETVRRLWLRLGFPDPGHRKAFRDGDVVVFGLARAGIDLFDPEEIEKFSLVIGMAARRITEAASALALDRLARLDLPPAEALTQRSVATVLLRSVAEDLVPAVLKHSIQAGLAFNALVAAEGGGRMCVGFCDLSGSTSLLNSTTASAAMEALAGFEIEANNLVVRRRGQLVKFVGDEVMYSAASPADALAIGRGLLEWVAGNPVLHSARVGVAVGDVIRRDGDLFGPTVNRAARFTALAEVGALLVDAALTSEGVEELVKVRGFPDPVPVRVLES
jgi:adenylate cyclase